MGCVNQLIVSLCSGEKRLTGSLKPPPQSTYSSLPVMSEVASLWSRVIVFFMPSHWLHAHVLLSHTHRHGEPRQGEYEWNSDNKPLDSHVCATRSRNRKPGQRLGSLATRLSIFICVGSVPILDATRFVHSLQQAITRSYLACSGLSNLLTW